MLEGAATVFFGDRSFKVGAVATQRYDQKLIFMSFTDITEFAELFSKYKRTRPSVLLLVIDNYEDVLQKFQGERKGAGGRRHRTMLEDFMSQTTGVLRKLGHDKFIAVIEEQHLNNIIQSKFEILDKARNISIGEKSSIITLSIGVGRGALLLKRAKRLQSRRWICVWDEAEIRRRLKQKTDSDFSAELPTELKKKSRAKSRIILMRYRNWYITATMFIYNGAQVCRSGRCRRRSRTCRSSKTSRRGSILVWIR